MSDPGVADDRPQALLARTVHIARLLLAEQPGQIDDLIAGSMVELPEGWQAGRSVMSVGSGASTRYFVIEHGTVTTRTALPDWADETGVPRFVRPDVRGVSVGRLTETADLLRARGPTLYEGLRVGETVETVEQYYGATETAMLNSLFQPLRVPVGELESLLGSSEAARRWLRSEAGRLHDEFLMLRLPFEPTFRALATVMVLVQVEDPRPAIGAGVLRVVRPDLGPDDIRALAGDAAEVLAQVASFPLAVDRLGPPPDPGFYALELEARGAGGVTAAHLAMRALELTADRQVDSARRQSSLERFYFELASAALQYRAADAVCAFLVDLHTAMDADATELRARRVIYEERRVTMVGSFFHASGLGNRLDPTSMPSLGYWINHLATLPAAQARADVHDNSLRLVVPNFMRDLVLGSVWRLTGRTEAALAALQRTHEFLDAASALDAALPWEPNFLVPLSRELADVHESLGHDRAAAELRERAANELDGRPAEHSSNVQPNEEETAAGP